MSSAPTCSERGPVRSALTGENVDQAVDKARDLIGGFFK